MEFAENDGQTGEKDYAKLVGEKGDPAHDKVGGRRFDGQDNKGFYGSGDQIDGENGVQIGGDVTEDLNLTPEFGPGEKKRIVRNICVIGIAFMVHFTAYLGAGNLQSSINAGLGTAALATVNVAMLFSNVFLPVIVIRWIGCKWAMALSLICFMPYIGAQFYPTYYTLIPAGLLVGLGSGLLWCAQLTYLTVAAEKYQKLSGISFEVLTVRFFGISFMFFQLAQIWGNLISSLVLGSGSWNNASSAIIDVREVCGAKFCPTFSPNENDTNFNLNHPDDAKIFTMAGIYLVCMAIAVVVVIFGVDSLKR